MAYFAKDSVFFPVIITEFLVILIINAVTIAAFARINHLRKRSTYLIINLTVADLLVGAVAGHLHVYHQKKENLDFTWPGVTVFANSLRSEPLLDFLRSASCNTLSFQALLNKEMFLL